MGVTETIGQTVGFQKFLRCLDPRALENHAWWKQIETEFQNFQNFRIEKKAGITWFLVISTI
jgi:hypothetical protein